MPVPAGPPRAGLPSSTSETLRVAMDTGDLIDAVRGRRVVQLEYRGGTRLVYPHAVYRSAGGTLGLEAVQIPGASRSGDLPGWRVFRLMEITISISRNTRQPG